VRQTGFDAAILVFETGGDADRLILTIATADGPLDELVTWSEPL
jgi:hypothetical protein